MTLEYIFKQITPPDKAAEKRAHDRWSRCSKPLGSLGLLEIELERIAALTGSDDIDISNRSVIVLCADNGVVRQGVTQTDSSVTGIVAKNLALRRTSVCRMAERVNCNVVPVDIGIKDFQPYEGVLSRRIGNGTNDISIGEAMSREQAEQAIITGIDLVKQQKEQGIQLIATGEMGIGNTTTSSAVASVLFGCEPERVTGRGAGLSDAGLERKINAINRAISVNNPNPDDIIDVLSKIGGFDIAGMCGIFIGGAMYKVPVLIDGFISAVSALCAVRLCPECKKAIFASHVSAEPAGKMVLDALGKKPLITAEMRLGEGTGAVAAISLLDMARAVYAESYTFEDAGIKAYTPYGDA